MQGRRGAAGGRQGICLERRRCGAFFVQRLDPPLNELKKAITFTLRSQ